MTKTTGKLKRKYHAEIERTPWRDITNDDEHRDALVCPQCGDKLQLVRSHIMWANQHGWERRYFCCSDSYTHIKYLRADGTLQISTRRYGWREY